ncbi:MAG: helix-turn-helix domain-containing protein [Trebonia sp.]
MTVGEALTEARNHAGLSVEELSERTKIRGTIIRSIEQDDYDACGGDLYVRGYVRAIAGAVGIDAQPLVREYDLGRSGGNGRTGGSAGWDAKGYPSAAPPVAARTAYDLPVVPEAPSAQQPSTQQLPAQQEQVPPAALNATRYDMPAVAADPAPTAYDLPRAPEVRPAAEPPTAELAATDRPTAEFPSLMAPVPPPAAVPPAAVPPGPMVPPGPVLPPAAATRYDLTALPEAPSPAPSEDLMAAGYDLGSEVPAGANAGTQAVPAVGFGQAPPPAATAWPAPAQASAPRKNRRGVFIVAAAAVVVALGALGVTLVSRGGSTTITSASGVPRTSGSASVNASGSAVAQPTASVTAKASASASASSPAARAKHVTHLPVASVIAFGPDGTADGDNPGNAADAIAATSSRPWTTQWYATAKFGMLKHGTGLLLDLGGKVTVTTVRLDLSQYQGTDLQLRVGDARALQDLQVVATANYVGGAMKLTLRHPKPARYLLVWFTMLPPDGAGHYRETVSDVSVTGRTPKEALG